MARLQDIDVTIHCGCLQNSSDEEQQKIFEATSIPWPHFTQDQRI